MILIVREKEENNRLVLVFCHVGSNVLAADKQFQEIEETMSNLESTIKHLDAYSRSLESQVKKFEKMSAANRTKSSKKE